MNKNGINKRLKGILPKISIAATQYEERPEIKVSAIVSTYNSERFIRGCLEDLITQTLYQKGELEIILVDSGSQQNEKGVVEEFRQKYENIKYMRTEEREPVYAAWNRGIKTASGKYITNANTDDRHRKDALEIMAHGLDEHPDVGLVYANVIITETENETFEKHTPAGYYRWEDFSREKLSIGCFIGPQPMWRKSLHEKYGYFDETFSSSGDWEFWLRIAEGTDFLHIHEFLGLYLRSPQSLEHRSAWQRMEEDRVIYRRYITKYFPAFEDYFTNLLKPGLYDRSHVIRYGQILAAFDKYDKAINLFTAHLQKTPENKEFIYFLEELKKAEMEEKVGAEAEVKEKERMSGVISIIVLLSGRREYARKCVESIGKHTKEPHEIIFIPRDASYAPPKWLRKMLKEHKNYKLLLPPLAKEDFLNSPLEKGDKGGCIPELEEANKKQPLTPPLVRGNSSTNSCEKLTYAQACNKGITESKGEYITVLGDDTVMTEDWLSGMLECLASFADIGIVGPMTANVEGPQGIRIETKGSRIQGFEDSSENFTAKHSTPGTLGSLTPVTKHLNPRTLESSDPEVMNDFASEFRERNRYRRVPLKNLSSFCISFKRELTEKTGLFDEGFETDEYAGDDYCIRAAVEGFRNLIAGDVFIHYYGRYYGRIASPALKDKIALGKKWGDIDGSKPGSKKIYCTNAFFAADELNQKGQKEKAVLTLVEGIKSYPDERRLRYALAEILLEDKKYKEALDLLDQTPGGFTKDAKELELRGACKIYMGLSEEACKYSDEILLVDNASPKAWNLKGTVAFQRGSYAEAERFFQKAIESDRGFGEAYANIGALRWASGNKEGALKLFEKAFILSPTVEDIVTNYYTAVVSLSKLHEAERNFEEAISLHPFNRRLKFILIDNLLQQGKYNEAMKAMEEAMDIFGIDDDTLNVALKLRDTIGPMEIGKTQGSRIQGFKDSSEDFKGTHSAARTLESSTPGTLSLCMIVKNEEKNIVRSLMSLKPVVDEMIVVDTGSTDRTKKIARAFGAKVYDFPWTDSFSDARNFSLSKASGSWVLILDADEVISPSDYGKLKELIIKGSRGQGVKDSSGDSKTHSDPRILESSNPAKASYSFVSRNYVGPVSANWNPNDGTYKEEAGSGWFPSGKVRLFPNDSRIRFEKPVHETVEDSLLRIGIEIRKCDIPIHHYGKLDKEEIMAKGEEYYQLGKKKLSEKGEHDPHALYELAVQATELEKYDEALEFWKKLTDIKPDFAKAYYGMGTSCYHLGRYKEARDAYKKAIELDPDSKDAAVMYATSELLSGNADVAVSFIETLLKDDPGYPLAFLAATVAYLCAGRKEKGLEYAKKVENTQFSLAPYLSDIAKLLISVKRYDYAIALLEAAVETNNVTDETERMLDECRELQGSRGQGVEDSSKIKDPRNEGAEERLSFPLVGNPSEFPLRKGGERGLFKKDCGQAAMTEGTRTLESSTPGTLSLCMIAKNEEDNIGRALMSVKPVVDEMIVVDTGSTDRTKDIARALGAKVYDFKWTNSFSEARNFSLSKASGKWILVLDADETISPLDYEKLKGLIEEGSRIQRVKESSDINKAQDSALKPSPDSSFILHPSSSPVAPWPLESSDPAVAYSFVTRTYVAQMNTIGWTGNDGYYKNEEAGTGWFPGEKVRLFPNDSRIRFDFPLHERIEPSLIKAGIEIRKCDIPVHHYGNFVKKDKAGSKAELYYELGKRKIAEQGEQNFMAFYELAIQGAELGKHEETLKYLKKVTTLKPDFSKAYQSIGNTYYNLGKYKEALPFYKKALELDPGARDTILMYATTEIIAGDAEKSISLLEQFLRNDPSYPQALLVIAEAYFCMGKKERGLEFTERLKDMHFNIEETFVQFAGLLVSASRCDYAISLLKSAFQPDNMTNEVRGLLDECRKKNKE